MKSLEKMTNEEKIYHAFDVAYEAGYNPSVEDMRALILEARAKDHPVRTFFKKLFNIRRRRAQEVL